RPSYGCWCPSPRAHSVVRRVSTYLILEFLPACTHFLHQLGEAGISVQWTKQRIALGEKRVVNEPAVDGALQPSQGFVLAAKDRLGLRHDVRVLEVAPELALEIGGCQGLRSRGFLAERVPENVCQCGEWVRPGRGRVVIDESNRLFDLSSGRHHLRHHHWNSGMIG